MKVLSENRRIGNENAIANYEEVLKKYFKAKFCVAVSSGTAALMVALKVIGVQTGHEIITSPVGPLCTAYPIMYSGGEIVFSDIEQDSLGLQQSSLANCISKRTKAIIEVPMWGYPINAQASKAFAAFHSIPLIFDLAHCIGTEFNQNPLSAYCDIACFSTQKNKTFSTGEGGFIITDNEDYYHKAIMFSRMGNLNGLDFGINLKLSPILAEIGILEMEELENNLNIRVANTKAVKSLIENPNVKEVEIINGGKPNYQRLLIRTVNGNTNLAPYLAANDIPTDMEKYNIKPLYEYDILKSYYKKCANAEKFLSTAATIAVHDLETNSDAEQLANVINNFPN